MADANDMALLREYADSNSEPAFAEIVHRHINLVYSVALRFTGNGEDAQDVTQAVFVILAKKATSISPKTVLAGWLYETTRFTAMNFLTGKTRRQAREQEAYMQSILDSNTESIWRQLAPMLEDAMTRLSEKERTLVALRFFENRSVAETAAALGIQEWAARKRVERALEKLQQFFAKRGVTSTAATIAGAISANSVQAAPAMLAKSVTFVAITKGAAASGSTLTLIKGALKIMAWTKMKTAIVIGLAVALAGTGSTLIIRHQRHTKAETDFPKSAWTTAGHADAPSALASVLLDASQGNGDKLLDDLSPGMRRNFQQQFEKQIQAQGITLAQLISQMGSHWSSGVDGFHIVSQETNADQVAIHIQPQGKNHLQTFTMKKINGEWKLHNFKDE
jgi:RNA polymerase sigma factor (sigma-70 family)